jgi:hypothetical protein
MTSQLQYQVLITPLIAKDVYGAEIDVSEDIDISEFVSEKGIGKIKNQIDNGDYEFGIFTFSDITLNMINYDGRFNDEFSSYSIFKYRRDLAKVKITFVKTSGTAQIVFEGVVNDEATRQDNNKGTVKFKVLSYSSIFKKTKVPAGIITNGLSFSTAIKNILNVTDITSLLTFEADRVNVGLDLPVDDGSKFDDKTVQAALNSLLLVSSSIMYIDANQRMNVTTRSETNSLHTFYGGNEVFGRENIISIKKFNSGLHRMFNSLVINGVSTDDPISINRLGVRQKSLSFDFLTNSLNYLAIGNRILDDFRHQRTEMEIAVRTEDSSTVSLLDLVLVDFTAVARPADGKEFFPLYGISEYGDDNYPLVNNPLPIRKNELYRVIGVDKDPKKFVTTIKLRASGGTIDNPDVILPVYGQGIYGQSKYQDL